MALPVTINVILVLVCAFRHFHHCVEFTLAAPTHTNHTVRSISELLIIDFDKSQEDFSLVLTAVAVSY